MQGAEIQVGGRMIALRLEKGRAIRLKFDGAVLVVSTPSGRLDVPAQTFIHRKARWIERHHERLSAHNTQRETYITNREQELWLQGRVYPIESTPAKRFAYTVLPEGVRLALPGTVAPQKAILTILRREAQAYFTARTAGWAAEMSLAYNRIVIKAHKSKWGSCSSLRNLNFNVYAVMLPPAVIDYLIIHELCHLWEPNHSPRFWAHVQRFCPSYKHQEEQLNAHQWIIGVYD